MQNYLNLDRIVFVLEEYPEFKENNYDDISISVYEIYPKKEECKHFRSILNHYYNNI